MNEKDVGARHRRTILAVVGALYLLGCLGLLALVAHHATVGRGERWPFPLPPAFIAVGALWLGVIGVGALRSRAWARSAALALHGLIIIVMTTLTILHETGVRSLGAGFSLPAFLLKAGLHLAVLLLWWRAPRRG